MPADATRRASDRPAAQPFRCGEPCNPSGPHVFASRHTAWVNEPAGEVKRVSTNKNDPLKEIEQTQSELRKSIEHSRELAEKSQQLLDKHRREMEQKDD